MLIESLNECGEEVEGAESRKIPDMFHKAGDDGMVTLYEGK